MSFPVSTRSIARRAMMACFLILAACSSNPDQAATPTTPLALPTMPSIASTSAPATTPTPSTVPTPSSLPLGVGLPVADSTIDSEPGVGEIAAADFAEIEIGDDPVGAAVHVMTSFTPVGPMSYYKWVDASGEPCVGFTEEGVASWGCGDARPTVPIGTPGAIRLGASWNEARYIVTPDPLPPHAIALDVITDLGHRVRTVPVDGFAIISDTFDQGVPVQVVVHYDDGTKLVQNTNFAFNGAPSQS